MKLGEQKRILTAGPTISQREIDYVLDAVQNGWNENWSGYLVALRAGVRPICRNAVCLGHV